MAVGAYGPILPRDPHTFTGGLLEYPEAASQTFTRGTPVIIDANGRVAAAGAAPALIFGIACDPGQNGTAGQYNTRVWPLRASEQWQISLLEALAQTQIGLVDAGVVKDATTGYWYASTADAGAQARIVDYLKAPAGLNIGDTKATIYVVFHTTKIQVI